MQRIRIHHLLAAILGAYISSTALAACTVPPIVESDEQTVSSGNGQGNGLSSADVCASADASMQPLTTPDDGQLFEQFNFQPQDIAVSSGAVSVQTPYYTFLKCEGEDWKVSSSSVSAEDALSYAQYLKSWGDPDYTSTEFAGNSYEYRIRLQATWLDEQIKQEVDPAALEETNREQPGVVSADGATEAPAEEAVYFDLKTPDGEVTSHRLYTMADVREAGIGASLGVPRIADIVVTEDAIWFAATSSQGEGENGFASLLRYAPESDEFSVQRPDIQGDQITSMVATGAAEGGTESELTLWLGTMRSGEGNPTAPASGLVAYSPTTQSSNAYTLTNSPIVGAIPHRLAIAQNSLWVATGNGICKVDWQSINQAASWNCWRFTTTAALPPEGIALYDSFLSEEPATTLRESEVEVLWVSADYSDRFDADSVGTLRYEVAYEPGFEKMLAQGGYRLDNEVARKMAGGNAIFWPGRQWHWDGDRFSRTLDEVSLNLVGGGPQGLIGSNISSGFSFDHYAIRGDFDLLSLGLEGTEVRYYSGWIEGADLDVYPKLVTVQPAENARPNPLSAIAQNLPNVGP